METLIDLVKRYQRSSDPAEQLALADQIVVRVSPDLHLYITLRTLRTRTELVDEILQETLIAVGVRLDTFVGDTNERFYGFCYTLCRNKIVDALRKDGRISAHEFTGDELWEAVLNSEHKEPLTQEDRERLREALDLLEEVRPPCRKYLVAFFVEEMTHKEMSEEFGFPSEAAAGAATRRCLQLARELVKV